MQFPEEKIGLNGPSEMEIENGFWIAAKLKWLVYTITIHVIAVPLIDINEM